VHAPLVWIVRHYIDEDRVEVHLHKHLRAVPEPDGLDHRVAREREAMLKRARQEPPKLHLLVTP
jgi:hypothetical protein